MTTLALDTRPEPLDIDLGIATNVCVESTLRDADFHEYWPILVADGAMQPGPATACD